MIRDLLDGLNRADGAGHVALARHLCELILAEEPDHWPTLTRYASILVKFSLYDRAAAVLDMAERAVPQKRRHLVIAGRGHLQMARGEFEEALKQYMAAHHLGPDDATYLIYAGTAAFATGDIQGAEALARDALKCSEGCHDEAYFNLGGYLLALKKYAEARSCYLRALEIDPVYKIAQSRLDDVDRLLKYQSEQGSGGRDHNAPLDYYP